MKKSLRLFFVAALALVSSFCYAQTTVTFTAGTDKGTQTNAGNAGDKVTKDGITIETTSGNSAFAAAQYRFSKSSVTTFSSTVGNITKIVFTCSASGDAKYGPGCFTTPSAGSYTYSDKVGTWTGNAASFTLTASSNQVRATKIEVTYTPSGATSVAAPTISGTTPFTDKTTVTITVPKGTTVYYTTDGSTPTDQGDDYSAPFEITATTTVKAVAYNEAGTDHSAVVTREFVKQEALTGDGTEANPYTPTDILNLAAIPSGEVYIKGKVVATVTGSDQYKNANYYISVDGTKTSQLQVYRGKYLDGADFTSKQLLEAGDEVVVKGKIKEYNKSKEVDDGSSIITINGKKEGKTAEEIAPTDKGGSENPYTPSEVMALTKLPAAEVYVKGKVVKEAKGTSYKNANYYLSDDGTEANQMEVFRGKYLGGADFTADQTLKAGDEVVVKGKISTFNNANQIAEGSIIISINGATSGINSITADKALDENAPIYNISGQRVGKDFKGIVIQNGKKHIQK